jgi:hypothetical protein
MTYTIEPEWLRIGTSQLATPTTLVEFEGSTAYGTDSRIPFRVTTADWQESDRLMAGILTAFGAQTSAIEIGGHGTFEGVMLGAFKAPRIEGVLAGDHMRAWGVDWGAVKGKAVIENSYVDATDVAIGSGQQEIRADGRFSAGFPRKDGGEEINARIRVTNWPVEDLRRAFGILDYNVDGVLSGEFHPYGPYQRPLGFGTMTISNGVAYGEPFDSATASVRLEGDGVRLDSIQLVKGDGRGNGAAYVGWNGTYSFNLDGRAIPVETVSLSKKTSVPLSGLIDFTAGGSGTFDSPRYDVRGAIRDLFAGDEGIGQLIGEIGVTGDLMTVKLEVASSRLSVSGSGRVALTPEMDTELTFRVTDTSLDPYIRAFEPRCRRTPPRSPAAACGWWASWPTSITCWWTRRWTNSTPGSSTTRWPTRRRFTSRSTATSSASRTSGWRARTPSSRSRARPTCTTSALRAAARRHQPRPLQGFLPNVRSSGARRCRPRSTATERAARHRRHDGAERPHPSFRSAERARERARADPLRLAHHPPRRSVRAARRRTGDVRRHHRHRRLSAGRIDVTMTGEQMRLRFPEGVRSTVDAQLAVRGTPAAATLSGTVDVREAVYTRPFNLGNSFVEFGGSALAHGAAAAAPRRPRCRCATTSRSTRRPRCSCGTTPCSWWRAPTCSCAAPTTGRSCSAAPRSIAASSCSKASATASRAGRWTRPTHEARSVRGSRNGNAGPRAGRNLPRDHHVNGTFDRALPGFSSDPPLPESEILALLFSDVTPGQDVEFRRYSTDMTPQQALVRERATRALTGAVTNEVAGWRSRRWAWTPSS